MKRLLIFCAAFLTAVSSFGTCNEYGWTNKGEMFLSFQEDVNAEIQAYNDTATTPKYPINVVKEENDSIFYYTGGEWIYWETVEKANTPVGNANNDFAAVTYGKDAFLKTVLMSEKWAWLDTIIAARFVADHPLSWEYSHDALQMRAGIQGFFFCSPSFTASGNTYPSSGSFVEAGKYINFQSIWGEEFCVKEDCNKYGWKNKGEMFLSFQEDVNAEIQAYNDTAASPKYPINVVKVENDSVFYYTGGEWIYWETVEKANTPVGNANNDFAAVTYGKDAFLKTVLMSEKWAWLDGILAARFVADHPLSWEYSHDALQMRAGVQGFFFCSPAFTASGNTYPSSGSFVEAGKYINFQPIWGEKFCTGSATAKVTYDLQGAVTNDYGWMKAEDMYWAFVAEYNARVGSEVVTEFGPQQFYNPTYEDPVGAKTAAVWATLDSVKWNWLRDYIIDKTAEQTGKTVADAETYLRGTASAIRGGVDNFFNNCDFNNGLWNQSFKGSENGVAFYAKYADYWKHAWDNPTEFSIDTTIVLNAPYKEGETFNGWYLNAAGAGDPVVELTSFYNNMTLYAVFGAYVNNMKEVWDMFNDTLRKDSTWLKTGGIVTHINGGQFYIQDDFGGMQCHTKDLAIALGDKITVEGALVDKDGLPQIVAIKKYEVKAQGQEVPVSTITLNAAALTREGHCYTKVAFESLKLYSAKDKNLYFYDGKDSLIYYHLDIKAADYTIGKRYAVGGVLTVYKGQRELVSPTIDVTPIASVAPDPATYADVVLDEAAGKSISIKSNWLISVNNGNWDSYKPNPNAEQSRGMAVAGGKVYVNWRSSNTPDAGTMKLNVYDAASGDKLDDVFLKDYVFQQPAADTTGTRVTTDEETGITYLAEGYEWNYDEFDQGVIFAPCTDMEADEKGHILLASLPTEGHVFQIWKVDPATGEGEVIVYMGGNSGISDLAYRFPQSGTIRLDRIAVYGDVEGDAIIISASQNTNYVYEFDIKDGKWDGEVYEIICLNGANPGEEGVAFSYTPRLAFAEGGEAFYVDGFATYPELFDLDGNMLESFKGVFDEEGEVVRPSCLDKLYNDSAIAPSVGVCGCLEFKVGDVTMFSMAAGSYEGSYEPYSSTKIFAFADENCHFDEIIPAWEVSKDGFGKVKNAQFNYVQAAVVVDEKTTELYVYVSENGLGKYTITLNGATGLNEVIANTQEGVKKVMINGQIFIIRNGVAYTTMGQITK